MIIVVVIISLDALLDALAMAREVVGDDAMATRDDARDISKSRRRPRDCGGIVDDDDDNDDDEGRRG